MKYFNVREGKKVSWFLGSRIYRRIGDRTGYVPYRPHRGIYVGVLMFFQEGLKEVVVQIPTRMRKAFYRPYQTVVMDLRMI